MANLNGNPIETAITDLYSMEPPSSQLVTPGEKPNFTVADTLYKSLEKKYRGMDSSTKNRRSQEKLQKLKGTRPSMLTSAGTTKTGLAVPVK